MRRLCLLVFLCQATLHAAVEVASYADLMRLLSEIGGDALPTVVEGYPLVLRNGSATTVSASFDGRLLVLRPDPADNAGFDACTVSVDPDSGAITSIQAIDGATQSATTLDITDDQVTETVVDEGRKISVTYPVSEIDQRLVGDTLLAADPATTDTPEDDAAQGGGGGAEPVALGNSAFGLPADALSLIEVQRSITPIEDGGLIVSPTEP